MSRLPCTLICSSAAESLTQIYTGFGLLARRGIISVRHVRASDFVGGVVGPARLVALVGDSIRICYDTADGAEMHQGELADCSLYFKRSYDGHGQQSAPHVRPLGLNYPAYGPGDGALIRALWALRRLSAGRIRVVLAQLARATWLSAPLRANGGRHTSSVEHLEGLPLLDDQPLVVFLARAWDPRRARRDDLADERRTMNDTRARCIRLLRQELGPAFVGGFAPDPFTLREYADCVVPARMTRKSAYLSLLHRASVGIATTGLQGSNGWKLGEYVAAAKAIVTEPLRYSLPGRFEPDRNYLLFRDEHECLKATQTLIRNRTMRHAMMHENLAYYRCHLRPDALVLNTLIQALNPDIQTSRGERH
jgi:hypothetical protein